MGNYISQKFSTPEEFEKYLEDNEHGNKEALDNISLEKEFEWDNKACQLSVENGKIQLKCKNGNVLAEAETCHSDEDTVCRDPNTGALCVKGVKEKNSGKTFTMWIGTAEQFKNIRVKNPTTVYWITDDTTLNDIYNELLNLSKRIEKIENGVTKVPSAERATSSTYSAEAELAARAYNADSVEKIKWFYNKNAVGGHYIQAVRPIADNGKFQFILYDANGTPYNTLEAARAFNADNATRADYADNATKATTATKVEFETGELSQDRYVWFSQSDNTGRLNIRDGFTYNPATQELKVGKVNGVYLSNTNTVNMSVSKVNNLEIKQDANGVLKIGDIIISQKKLIFGGNTLDESGQYLSGVTLDKTNDYELKVELDGCKYTLKLYKVKINGTVTGSTMGGTVYYNNDYFTFGKEPNKGELQVVLKNAVNGLGYTGTFLSDISYNDNGTIKNLASYGKTCKITHLFQIIE